MPASSDLKINAFWGDVLYDTAICPPRRSITVGKGIGNTFILDVPQKKIVEVSPGKSARLFFSEELKGHVYKGKEMLSLAAVKNSKHALREADGSYSVLLTEADRADVVIGHMTFYFAWLDQKTLLPHEGVLDKKSGRWLACTLLFLLALAVPLIFFSVKEEEKPPERLVLILQTPAQGGSQAAVGEQKTDEGGAEKGDPGTQSVVSSLKSSGLANLVNRVTAVGGSMPAPKDEAPSGAPGGSGLSTEGLKSGAGGKTQGIGRTLGQGEGGFAGTGKLGLSGHSLGAGSGSGTGAGRTVVSGGLDRDVIEGVIRRRLDRIRLCYERQLNFNPKLSGKISVHFVIGKNGEVLNSSANEDTMKNAQVRDCVLSEVKTWTFPSPVGGTLVNVDYPFVFESGGIK